MPEYKKREIAHKMRIGDILSGTPIVEEIPQEAAPNPNEEIANATQAKERFRFLEFKDKRIVRVNIIANIVDMYNSAGDKQYSTLTVDDATGQIRIKAFGDSINLINSLSHGDTILIIGVLRIYGGEVYVSPEIVKKTDSRYLLIRKLEIEGKAKNKEYGKEEIKNKEEKPKTSKEMIIELIKSSGDSSGISTEDIILKINSANPEAINSELIRLIEDGLIYEPRPGRVRWLG